MTVPPLFSRLDPQASGGAGCRSQERALSQVILHCADLANLPVRFLSEEGVSQFTPKILPVTNFSECSRANKLRKQNTSNDSEDEGKTLFLWPKSQACRFP